MAPILRPSAEDMVGKTGSSGTNTDDQNLYNEWATSDGWAGRVSRRERIKNLDTEKGASILDKEDVQLPLTTLPHCGSH